MNITKLRRGVHGGALAVAASAVLFAWQASGAVDSKAESEGIIFERQQVMEQMGKDADVLGKIVAGQLPADRLAATAKAIAQGAHDSVDAFKQQVPGGHAKPEVWSNNADFSARMEKFATNADAMAKAAETGDMTAVMGMMVEALPCKECHDVYREKKKS